jgi:hypothetical protein
MPEQKVLIEQGNECDKCRDLRAHEVTIHDVPANLCARCYSFFKGNEEYERLKDAYRKAKLAVEKYAKDFIGFR